MMARFRERATVGDGEEPGGKLRGPEPRFSRFIPRIWIHSAGQPTNQSGHSLMPGSLYASWPPTRFRTRRNTGIDRGTKVARFLSAGPIRKRSSKQSPTCRLRFLATGPFVHVQEKELVPLLSDSPFIMQRNDVWILY